MELAIIAAGEGTRLKSEGVLTSKPLIRIQNVPIIERIIKNGIANGLGKVYCIINESSPDLAGYLASAGFGERLELVIKSTSGSFHSFMELARRIKNSTFVLSAADSVFREDEFRNFINTARSMDCDGLLAVTRFVDDEKPLYTDVDDEGFIKRFSNSEGEFVTGGIYCLTADVRNELKTAEVRGIMHLRQFFSLLLEKGFRLKAFEFSKIIDVDHIDDINAAEQLLIINPLDTE